MGQVLSDLIIPRRFFALYETRSILHRAACLYLNIMASTLLMSSLFLDPALGSEAAASIKWSKDYSSQGIAPVVNDYVSYELNISNVSDMPIENQSLWVSFVSEGGKTSVQTKFRVDNIDSKEQLLLHLGPFKMRETGEYNLYLGMNRQGDSSLPNEIALNYGQVEPVDSFVVYESTTIQVVIPVAISLVLAGVSALVFISHRKKKHKKEK